jgi:sporulation related protein
MSNVIRPAAPDDDGAPGYNYDYDDEPPPRGKLRRPAIAIAGIAVLLGALWVGYGMEHKRSPGETPLIRADDTATKARPAQPGGMTIPDQDKLVYDQGRAQAQVEKLLPSPEAPLPGPTAEPDGASNLPTGSAGTPPILAAGAAPPQPTATAPSSATPPSATPPAAPARPPAAPTVAMAAPPAHAAPATTGSYRIQVGAMRSDDSAKQEWERIKLANKDLLGNVTASWTRVDLGAKGIFYRIQTHPVADADRLCNALKQRNVGCILVRP